MRKNPMRHLRRLRLPIIGGKNPQPSEKIYIDNYIIYELFFREDHPEYFTEEERTFKAIVEYARVQRERDEELLELEQNARG